MKILFVAGLLLLAGCASVPAVKPTAVNPLPPDRFDNDYSLLGKSAEWVIMGNEKPEVDTLVGKPPEWVNPWH